MSLGLPSHLARSSLREVRLRAGRQVALVGLASGLLVMFSLQAADTSLILWPAILAIIVFGIQLALLISSPSLFLSISYLIVGAASTYSIAIVVLSQRTPGSTISAFLILVPQTALVLVGGVGVTASASLLWLGIGWVVAEATARLAALQAGTSLDIFQPIQLVLLIMGGMILLEPFTRGSAALAQPSLHRAVRDQELASLRDRIELKANALMHDTVLSQLAAIANSKGPLPEAMRQRINDDLSLLVGEEWLSDVEPSLEEDAGSDWVQSDLFAAIQDAQLSGLTVDVTGDLTGVSDLDPVRSRALGMAVKQCLANVTRHAGVDKAEVVVYGSVADLSVMVIDNGVGFAEDETGEDRLGLRNSIRRRIELVGGSVQLWSSAGSGTSIVIQLPLGPIAPSDEEVDDESTDTGAELIGGAP